MGALGVGAMAYFATVKSIALIEKGRVALKAAYNIKEKIGIGLAKTRNLIDKKGLVKGIGAAIMGVIKSLGAIPVIGAALGIAAAATAAYISSQIKNAKAETKSATSFNNLTGAESVDVQVPGTTADPGETIIRTSSLAKMIEQLEKIEKHLGPSGLNNTHSALAMGIGSQVGQNVLKEK